MVIGLDGLTALWIAYVAAAIAFAGLVHGMLGLGCFFTGKTTQLSTLVATGDVSTGVWLSTLPLCALAVVTSLTGTRIRNRVEASLRRGRR